MQPVDGKIKRKLIILYLVCFAVLIFTGNVLADSFIVKPVGGNGETDKKKTFGWNETPWIYVQLPQEGLNVTSALWERDTDKYYVTSYTGIEKDLWFSLDGGMDTEGAATNWNEAKQTGRWDISVVYTSFSGGSHSTVSETENFTVTPEPLSSILFLTGAATLAGRRYMRSRKEL